MLTVLLSACSSGDAAEETKEATHQQPQLAIYVYAPEQAAAKRNAAPTRADVGQVDPINNTTNEGLIKSLQIWVYESETGNYNYVGYFSPEDMAALNSGQGTTYQIPVSDEFAASKPKVNVYVMANVTNANCGIDPLNKETTRTQLLEGAKIEGHFGLGNLVKSVPEDGLPFAGYLTAQPVVGDAPTLRVGTLSAVSTVQLTRAVSKLRFVFAKTAGEPTVKITSIKMNAGMIPDVEYLFQTPASMTYNTEAEMLSTTIDDIAETDDPTKFIYIDQDAQTYEDLINEAANKQAPEEPEVTVEGPIYLRESDKQLTGTITYTIDGGTEQTVDFAMQQAGDFSRNHTWIVYAYYAGSGNLQVQSLYVKDWTTKEVNHQVYNW
jgi:hypothetical protein